MFNRPTSPMTHNRSPDLIDIQYLNELMSDRAALDRLPKRFFMHLQRLLDQEIVNVRQRVFDTNSSQKLELPSPVGEPNFYFKKVYIPENNGHFNFVGRLLGPRGKTLKRIEQDTGCKLMIRGIGASRPNFSNVSCNAPFVNGYSTAQYHSPQNIYNPDNDYLHVHIQCEDTQNRAITRINHAVSLIEELFAPVDEENDVVKQKQLLELNLMRGNFNTSSAPTMRADLFDSDACLFDPQNF